jgi:hypothetical protein
MWARKGPRSSENRREKRRPKKQEKPTGAAPAALATPPPPSYPERREANGRPLPGSILHSPLQSSYGPDSQRPLSPYNMYAPQVDNDIDGKSLLLPDDGLYDYDDDVSSLNSSFHNGLNTSFSRSGLTPSQFIRNVSVAEAVNVSTLESPDESMRIVGTAPAPTRAYTGGESVMTDDDTDIHTIVSNRADSVLKPKSLRSPRPTFTTENPQTAPSVVEASSVFTSPASPTPYGGYDGQSASVLSPITVPEQDVLSANNRVPPEPREDPEEDVNPSNSSNPSDDTGHLTGSGGSHSGFQKPLKSSTKDTKSLDGPQTSGYCQCCLPLWLRRSPDWLKLLFVLLFVILFGAILIAGVALGMNKAGSDSPVSITNSSSFNQDRGAPNGGIPANETVLEPPAPDSDDGNPGESGTTDDPSTDSPIQTIASTGAPTSTPSTAPVPDTITPTITYAPEVTVFYVLAGRFDDAVLPNVPTLLRQLPTWSGTGKPL